MCCSLDLCTLTGDGVIGIAWVPKVPGRIGGICERHTRIFNTDAIPGGYYSLNAVMITQLMRGTRLVDVVTSITVTHELGHSFGAIHDDDYGRVDCRPGTESAHGNYIMSATVLARPHQAHNWMFSTCSTEAMKPVVLNNGFCLERRPASYCGNLVVEDGEQCDCGTTYSCRVHDKCCTPSNVAAKASGGCQLTSEAVCSPRVKRCCTAECQPTEVGQTCRPGSDCSSESRCDGRSPSCPAPVLAADGAPCAGGRGHCSAGVCSLSPCQQAGLTECPCPSPPNLACSLCCRCAEGPDDICVPASWIGLSGASLLPPGTACVHGVCDNDARCVGDRHQ